MTTPAAPPSMLDGVSLGPRRKGYHYAYNDDGMLCIEVDEPAPDMVTITGQSDLGKTSAIIVDRRLFDAAMKSYVVEASARKK